MANRPQFVELALHLALEEAGCGHQDLDRAEIDALSDRLGSEGGEQRCEHGLGLQHTERGDVEVGNAAGQGGDPCPSATSESLENVGESVGPLGQLAVGEIDRVAPAGEPTQRHLVAVTGAPMPVDRLMSDVDPGIVWQPVETLPRLVPLEDLSCRLRSHRDSGQANMAPCAHSTPDHRPV